MRLKKIVFDNLGFRKLKNLELEISNRITVIGGLNGIGKTTLLGLIANASGVSGRNDPRSKTKTYIRKKSYFDLPYQANFQELFHLDKNDYSEELSQKGNIEFHYEIPEKVFETDTFNNFIKKCNVTEHNETKTVEIGVDEENRPITATTNEIRYKIVPRSVNKPLGTALEIGDDAKMPIPTIYLGMSRMTPIGEIMSDSRKSKKILNMDAEDKLYFESLFKKIITYDLSDEKNIIDLDFKHSHKKFKIPELKHNPFSISLGQDSLSSIFTALASFYSLKREYREEYKGGILVIDEIDAGLHHLAQEKLIELLKAEGRRLNLQIIFTTHSLTIFKKIINISKEQIANNKILDKVVYLYDTHTPKVKKNPNYLSIKNNQLSLNNLPIQDTKIIKVYFEDDEAVWFYEQLLKAQNITNSFTAFSIELIPVSLKLSCSILLNLAEADDFFKEVIIITDNDVKTELKNRTIISQNPNILSLPDDHTFDENTAQKLRTPERIIYNFIQDKYLNYDDEFWNDLGNINGGNIDYDYIGSSVLTLDFNEQQSNQKYRDLLKNWFNTHKKTFEDINLMKKWANSNEQHVSSFFEQLHRAINFVSTKKWPTE